MKVTALQIKKSHFLKLHKVTDINIRSFYRQRSGHSGAVFNRLALNDSEETIKVGILPFFAFMQRGVRVVCERY